MGRQEHPGMAGGNPQGALGFPFRKLRHPDSAASLESIMQSTASFMRCVAGQALLHADKQALQQGRAQDPPRVFYSELTIRDSDSLGGLKVGPCPALQGWKAV